MTFAKFIGYICKKILPTRIYRLVANGFIIVPKYYKSIINDAEDYRSLSLEESIEKDIMLMRKYAHIIDKGLHRTDISPGHSKTYAKLLELSLARISSSKYKDDPTTVWATSKLSAYHQLQDSPKSFQPLGTAPPSQIALSFEQLASVIKQRRSNRSFEEKEVPSEILDKLKDIANWAPSSCNKQPINIYSTNNPSIAKKCLDCCAGGTGFSKFIPAFLAITADCRGYVWPMEMYLPHIDASLATQNLLLAAHTLRLSGCILSWSQKTRDDDEKLRTILNIPKEKIIIFCIPMGYSNIVFETPLRKDYKQ